ncbi:MAG: (2Fe-2S)-binding protein [Peptococcaceae bacterium]|jgi:bacterioferritin-associated ferredoxin|nr:(2Fe-2S)-binding protein [Peptococcaceae bacterium]MDH7524631.1 (2Fe-2S)-binding protein [Peptococcaceae bacterium]
MQEGPKNYICRCEEVTREEIEEAIKNGATTMNEVKRWSRAGMGLCQGKICSRNVSRIVSEATGKKPEEVLPSTVRQPVRPVRIDVITKE